MKFLINTVVAVVGVVALSACASSIESVRNMQNSGSAFQKAAQAEYVAQAQLEVDESDWPNANRYVDKAERSTKGETVLPDDFNNRNIPADRVADLQSARAKLMAALDGGARESQPAKAAHCQAIFDCWMEEQHEGHQQADIKVCRDAYETCYAQLTPAPKPAPMPKKVSGPYHIYFDFNKADLDAEAVKTIDAVAADHAKNPGSEYTVKAYTDTSGSSAYNDGLSMRRAQAVRDALSARGIAAAKVKEVGLGETELEVATPDDVRERRNRRAVVFLVQ